MDRSDGAGTLPSHGVPGARRGYLGSNRKTRRATRALGAVPLRCGAVAGSPSRRVSRAADRVEHSPLTPSECCLRPGDGSRRHPGALCCPAWAASVSLPPTGRAPTPRHAAAQPTNCSATPYWPYDPPFVLQPVAGRGGQVRRHRIDQLWAPIEPPSDVFDKLRSLLGGHPTVIGRPAADSCVARAPRGLAGPRVLEFILSGPASIRCAAPLRAPRRCWRCRALYAGIVTCLLAPNPRDIGKADDHATFLLSDYAVRLDAPVGNRARTFWLSLASCAIPNTLVCVRI